MKLSYSSSMLLLLLGTCFVGGVAVFTKLASGHMISLHFILCLYLFSLPFSLPFGSSWKMKLSKEVVLYFFQHAIGIAFGWYLFTEGVRTVDVTTAAFTGRLEFFFLTISGIVLLKERFDKYFALAFLLAICGLLLIHGIPTGESIKHSSGVYLIALSSLGFASGEFASKKLSNITPLRAFIFWRNLFMVSIFSLIFFIKFDNPMEIFASVPKVGYLEALACSVLGPVGARMAYSKAMQVIPLSRISLFAQLEPFTTMILAVFFTMEMPTFYEYAGGFLIVLGCIVIWMQDHKKGPTKSALE